MQINKLTKCLGWVAYLLSIALLSLLILGSFLKVGINGCPPAMFRDMVDGTAHKPFVCRALAPALIRTVESAIPKALAERAPAIAGAQPVVKLFERYNWPQEDALTYLVVIGFFYVCLLWFVHAFGVFAKSQYEMNPVFHRVLTLVALAGLPCFFRYYSYLYDFLHLILFCYAMALMSRQKWLLYFPVFVLACFSKETTVLLIAVFIIHFWKSRHARFFAAAIGLQSLIFVFVKVWLQLHFKENPGNVVDFNFTHNVTLSPYGFAQYATFIGVAVLCARNWKDKPAFLKSAVWMTLPLVGSAVFLGYMDEYRDYYEVYPVILLLAVPSVAKYLRINPFHPKYT